MEPVREHWSTAVSTVTIGAFGIEGCTRTSQISTGGMKTLPFLPGEGDLPHLPVVAMEILDVLPEDYPDSLRELYGPAAGNPAEQAKLCVEKYGAPLVAIRLQGTHPDEGDRDPAHACAVVRNVLDAVSVPLIVLGCGVAGKDALVLPAVSREARGERLLIGTAQQENYRPIVKAAIEYGHSVIGESPIDINIAKQVNILMNDAGLPLDRIIMYPTTGGLGYGIEYAYSIMERSRLAALSGDRVLGVPMISFIGFETWRAKESRAENQEWGSLRERGIAWEATTAGAYLMAGADILLLWHPDAARTVRTTVEELASSAPGT
jgi:acetyl-CoA decarbonylase/synthase, CODH/ACS complex subunit delta